jgi:putative chitinase
MIANRIYANRMANGNEQSGDGWKFRGRGILQITGRANYTQCSRDLFGDNCLVDDPDLLRQPAYATLSACWFWHKNQLNHICDTGDIVLLSKKINGGTIGLEDRVAHWNAALDLFEGE